METAHVRKRHTKSQIDYDVVRSEVGVKVAFSIGKVRLWCPLYAKSYEEMGGVRILAGS